MTEHAEELGLEQPLLISLHQQQQVQYWTTRLGVSRNQLQHAIEEVGDSAPQVEAWLKYQRQSLA